MGSHLALWENCFGTFRAPISLKFIEPYIKQYKHDAVDGILEGAYGPRLLQKNGCIYQLRSIIWLLSNRPGSRRAVIQLFDADDIAVEKKEIPCTTTLQFHLRDNMLHMSVTMRSNDAYLGLPHDGVSFHHACKRCCHVDLMPK